jgi:hypothetical protein
MIAQDRRQSAAILQERLQGSAILDAPRIRGQLSPSR